MDIELTKQLAETAAIDLNPEELEAQAAALEEFVSFTEGLLSVNTEGLPARTHPFAETGENRLREDKVTNEDHGKEYATTSPDSKGRYFRVPRTVEV